MYYKIVIIGRKLKPLTYQSSESLLDGQLVSVKLKNSTELAIILQEVCQPDFECQFICEIKNIVLPEIYLKMAKFISDYYVCELGEAFVLFEFFEFSNKTKCQFNDNVSSVNLSDNQVMAYEFLKSQQIALLFGDTGSGKTEIYMKLIDDVLIQNKTAIILLPEISLTPQTLKRMQAHYGESVGIWHSKITKAKKAKTIDGIKNGTIKILLGARSALFVPMQNLGIIVVDEEHDDSFKSDSTPRYNAKDLAIWLGHNLNIKVVLGSATPSFASYLKFKHFRLKGGYYGGNKKFIYEDLTPQISNLILSNLKNTAQNDNQSIVFLPTRANYKYLVCKDCKKTLECVFCSVGVSLHKNESIVKCHYCGWSHKTPKKCPDCGGEISAHRIGTMEACEMLQNELQDIKIDVLDKDSTSTPKKLNAILDNFANSKTQILVGTQMLSKGHDYGNVKLAVVLGLDSVLASSDFRAKERALSLLFQLSGRAGRSSDAMVIVQTQNMDFFKKYIQDYEEFLKDELKLRSGRYPPYIKMCRLIFSASKIEVAKKNLENALSQLQTIDGIEIIGYGEALINRISGKFRYDILLKSASSKALIIAATNSKEFGASIDMDPINFM